MVCLAPVPTPRTFSPCFVIRMWLWRSDPRAAAPLVSGCLNLGCPVPMTAPGRLSPNCLTLLLRKLLIPSLITPGQLLPVVHMPHCLLAATAFPFAGVCPSGVITKRLNLHLAFILLPWAGRVFLSSCRVILEASCSITGTQGCREWRELCSDAVMGEIK